MAGLEYNIDDLFQEAKKRWLKPVEVLYILRNHDQCQLTHQPPHQPAGRSLFLYNKRVMRSFRKDGHNWRKKKDGRTVREAHERLKVGNVEILNCYYAHGEENRTFQRRSYWMLEPEYDHIVLVHYRETSEGKSNSEPVTQLSSGSSPVFSYSHSSYATPMPASMFDDFCEPNKNFSSPGSLEVTSDAQALCQLAEQLSSNVNSFNESALDLIPCQDQSVVYKSDNSAALYGPNYQGQLCDGYNERQDDSGTYYPDLLDDSNGNEKTIYWKELLESCKPLSVTKLPDQHAYEAIDNENSLISPRRGMIANLENNQWLNSNSNIVENYVLSFSQDGGVKFPPYVGTLGTNSDYYQTLFDPNQIQEPLGVDSSLTVVHRQKFTIQAVSPEYCYDTETTKVIIIGSFLCRHSDSTWACMFGDVEVPAEIIQDGVICCEAPPDLLGKVNLCITSGNRVPCSEVREFEFRTTATSCTRCNSLETGNRSPEDLLLLVRFAEMLHSASTTKNDNVESGSHLSTEQKDDDYSWSHIIDTVLDGTGKSSHIINWLLEELLKDKLQFWLSNRCHERDEGTDCSLSKKEQGIIHMVSGLGFEWALKPILSCGVNINFRDINGWTALHWASRFGREKMVASLIASGASAGAVTDPSSQDPTGKTAASIAAIHGHKGLAGYLSEVDLTSHLSSLTLEESENSKGSSELEAELTVHCVSKEELVASEDQISLKASLEAVRNAAQAAARIQAAFRAHSFRKRKEREAAAAIGLDGYCIDAGSIDDNISLLSAMSKHSSWSLRDYNSAAVSIQKKYRGWKGRKEFLAMRQKVVKIQACVRGYQVRKQYKLILWAVGILDKVVLRWRRKRIGIRIVRQEMESNEEESDDENFLDVFRKQKVNAAIEKALKQVLSIVHSTDARQQYRRLLSLYHQAKSERGSTSDIAPLSTSEEEFFHMEDDDLCHQFLETWAS